MNKSSKSPFPVHDALVLSGLVRPEPGMKFFDASQAFEVIPRGSKMGDYGPVTPPYESMWLEGVDVSEDGVLFPVAVHVESNAPSVALEGRRALVGHRVTSYAIVRGTARRAPVMATFTVDADGGFHEVFSALRAEDLPWADNASESRLDACVEGASRAAGLAIFSISLMHCRNIRQEQISFRPTPRRKTSRQRPSIEYHKIHLPAPGTSASGSTGQLTGTQKLHTARGHFKTYTAEAPLMGRHVGTYYWGWQVRGNRKNGEVISSYEVGATA